MKLTITDIARITGYAKSTVSAALNNKPGVHPKTREEILQAASENNFVPNEFARGLSMKRTDTIGIIVRDITNPFYAKVCRAIETTAGAKGFTTLLVNTDGDYDKTENAVRLMVSKMVSGIIIDSSGRDEDIFRVLEQAGMPFVVFGSTGHNIADSVETNDTYGAYEATEYLIQNGHRKIGFVHGGEGSVYSERRLKGIRDALKAHGLAIDKNHILHKAKTVQQGYEIGKRLVAMKERPTAIIAYNDLVAVGLLQALQAAGEQVPEHLSIIGFDDIDLMTFPLTTVAIPTYEMGQEAAKLLLDVLQEKRKPGGKKIVLVPRLLVRKSVKSLL